MLGSIPKKLPSGDPLTNTGEPAAIGPAVASKNVIGAAPTPVKVRSGTERAVVGKMSQEHVLREGIVENAISGAKHRRPLTRGIPGERHARSEILVVGIVESRWTARSADLHQRSTVVRQQPVEQIVLLARYTKVVPAQAQVQRQARRPAEAVLDVESVAVLVFVPVGVAGGLAPAGRQAFDKSNQIVEAEFAAEVRVLNDLDRGPAELVAELEIVTANLPGVIVDELPVGIHALPGHARAGAEHRRKLPTEIFGKP